MEFFIYVCTNNSANRYIVLLTIVKATLTIVV